MIVSGKRVAQLLTATLLTLAILLSALPRGSVYAATLTSRSLTLQAGATDGGSKPSGVVKHLFTFNIVSSSSLGSIKFLYCTTAGGTCTTPPGLSTTSATLGSQTGPATSFTLNNSTNGAPYLTRSANTVTTGTPSTFRLDSVTNPNNTNCFGGTTPQSNNCPFYVRITTYASTDTTGGVTDDGTVAASTATQITLTGTMPESLIFCTGGTISNTSGIPDCSTATSGAITFNQLFSPADTATATSQMAASTNADSGYAITVNGTTLTSGSNTVTAMTTNASGDAAVRGTSQFGLNLRANTSAVASSFPGSSADIFPANNGSNYKAEALTGYTSIDHFRFVTGESVADSTTDPSDIETYTVSYIVNVNGAQAVGTYTTTLTYICTATF
jgi:hypothetical protein